MNTSNFAHADALGRLTSDGYLVEIAIPWSGLGVTPADGVTIGFDIGVNDDDPQCSGSDNESRDGEIRWSGTALNFENPSQFGELTLSSQPAEIDTETETATETETEAETETETAVPDAGV